MSFPALPAPALTDAPNVPSDLGKVALAAEAQALAQYAGYNSANSPSATSIEARTSAIDSSTGSVASVEASSAALTSAVYAWTGSATSNIATQAAQTAAFPARQSGHDTLMATLNGQLATYEPQITSLISTRPAGLLFNGSSQLNIAVPEGASPIVAYYTFTPRAGAIYYRMSFSGTFNITGYAANQVINLTWIAAAGTTPQTGGFLAGITQAEGASNYPYLPISCFGVVAITGSGSPWTLALSAYTGGSGAGRLGTIIGSCATAVEDLGAHF